MQRLLEYIKIYTAIEYTMANQNNAKTVCKLVFIINGKLRRVDLNKQKIYNITNLFNF